MDCGNGENDTVPTNPFQIKGKTNEILAIWTAKIMKIAVLSQITSNTTYIMN